jgi:hypothetical protein
MLGFLHLRDGSTRALNRRFPTARNIRRRANSWLTVGCFTAVAQAFSARRAINYGD